jgi:hypothetical protein
VINDQHIANVQTTQHVAIRPLQPLTF